MNYHHFTLPGIVRQDCGDNSYFVEDSVGDLERIWREDIMTDQDDATHGILVSKPALPRCVATGQFPLRERERESENFEAQLGISSIRNTVYIVNWR